MVEGREGGVGRGREEVWGGWREEGWVREQDGFYLVSAAVSGWLLSVKLCVPAQIPRLPFGS